MFSFAHVSDLHATPPQLRGPMELLNKRGLGWLSWQLRRRRIHRPEIVECLIEDLHAQRPDHVVLTGDLTQIGLASEVEAARIWLERLGPAAHVTAIPGNHDAYVSAPWQERWEPWADYMVSDGVEPTSLSFPSVRRRGPVALVGVSSALPTGPLRASGCVGTPQLQRLETQLVELGRARVCRVVLIHHPPVAGVASPRRALDDAEALQAVLVRAGAELVLHGHTHRSLVGELPGPQRPIPVVGVCSASEVGSKPGKRSQYHLIEVEERVTAKGDIHFSLALRSRAYRPDGSGFDPLGEVHALS
ncbi:metallophosphoesterase [Myxococcota bacterium]|nr:metallophosphoesterase [Myxococcota bacterium]